MKDAQIRNRILVGDVRERLRDLPDESVHCCVTSPPYWGLRDYKTVGQLGLERTPEGYVANMVAVFREVRRVLRKDGTLWLNLGDSYTGGGTTGRNDAGTIRAIDANSGRRPNAMEYGDNERGGRIKHAVLHGLKTKDLGGMPWRVAFALQADGWWLRSDIIWSKPNPMPESVTDRPTKSHEYLFLLSKSQTYYYDADAIREPFTESSIQRINQPNFANQTGGTKDYGPDSNRSMRKALENFSALRNSGRNRRTVWDIPTEPYAEAHFATFPTALVLPCIQAGTSEQGASSCCGAPWKRTTETIDYAARLGKSYHDHTDDLGRGQRGVPPVAGGPVRRTTGWAPTCAHEAPTEPCIVLDPFLGSGTTALVAKNAGRDYVGIELNPEYVELARARIGTQSRLL